MVKGSEEKVQDLNQNSRVIFSDICPSVVLASLFIASFPPEIVCQPQAPEGSQCEHDPLSLRNGDVLTLVLIEKNVDLEKGR